MNSKEVAAVLGVSVRRVRQLAAAKVLPAETVGRDWVFREDDVEAFKSLQRSPGRPRKGGKGKNQ